MRDVRTYRIVEGDAIEGLRELPDGLARCCVTSPPYWGLRDYGVDGQIGLEGSLEEYLERIVQVFREVRRVLAPDGTLWLNLGDSYAHSGGDRGDTRAGFNRRYHGKEFRTDKQAETAFPESRIPRPAGLKPKDLIGVPWRVAFALQADGWWLRSEIIWSKNNPMPESITDRPTKAHEHVFLLSRAAKYFYDADAIREELAGNYPPNHARTIFDNVPPPPPGQPRHRGLRKVPVPAGWDTKRSREQGSIELVGRREDPEYQEMDVKPGRNRRTVWEIPTEPFPEAHFATFPTALVEPCIKAGSEEGDITVDPFAGSGTTGVVALRLNRHFVGVELNPEYAEMARRRIREDAPLLNEEAS